MNQQYIRSACTFGFLCLMLLSCQTGRPISERQFARSLDKEIAQSPVFQNSFTGFILQDAQSGQVISSFNADHYFVPASNTKILTFAIAKRLLGDTLPTLAYSRHAATLSIRGMGDPTFLHPLFSKWQAGMALLSRPGWDTILYNPQEGLPLRYGEGWMWDDYNDRYQPECSAFPMYGNTIWVEPDTENRVQVTPKFYANAIHYRPDTVLSGMRRAEFENKWYYTSPPDEPLQLPFRPTALRNLLEDTLHRPVALEQQTPDTWKVLYSTPTDTVYRQLMYHSDNHIAEQLLRMCAWQRYGTYDPTPIIEFALDSMFPAIQPRPLWVDGSGLSRYNLVTPRYLAGVLAQMYQQYSYETLCTYFPAGGSRGTISNWYSNPEGQSYVFAKTGSMSGVHCLSGYLTTKSGKKLIFSFMHNNFTGSNKIWKEEMQRILLKIYTMP